LLCIDAVDYSIDVIFEMIHLAMECYRITKDIMYNCCVVVVIVDDTVDGLH
jgi:hypothetical protein